MDGGIFYCHRAQEQVAVAADVLGEGLKGDVDAVTEGVEGNTGGPSVVWDNRNIIFRRGGCDRGNILYFHGERAGTFAPDETGVFLDEIRDGAAHERIVV